MAGWSETSPPTPTPANQQKLDESCSWGERSAGVTLTLHSDTHGQGCLPLWCFPILLHSGSTLHPLTITPGSDSRVKVSYACGGTQCLNHRGTAPSSSGLVEMKEPPVFREQAVPRPVEVSGGTL